MGLTDGCPQTSVMMARKVYRGPRPDETLRIHDCEGKWFFSSKFFLNTAFERGCGRGFPCARWDRIPPGTIDNLASNEKEQAGGEFESRREKKVDSFHAVCL